MRSRRLYGWTAWHLCGGVALFLGAIAVHLNAWQDIVRFAMHDEEASHIWLVPIVSVWLIWVRMDRFRHCRPGPSWVGPAMMACGWLIGTVGYYNALQAFWHGGAVLVAAGSIVTIAGRDLLLRFAPAFAVLVFLVPVPGMMRQQIAIPLQTATASVTQVAFEILGVPIDRTGNVLGINGVDVAIAEACNGMRMVFALLLVSYGFAFGTLLRNYVRLLIIVASPLSAIFCNVIRLLPTVWLYGYYPNNVAEKFHDVSGWLMLPVAFVILMAIIRLLRWALIPVAPYTLAYE